MLKSTKGKCGCEVENCWNSRKPPLHIFPAKLGTQRDTPHLLNPPLTLVKTSVRALLPRAAELVALVEVAERAGEAGACGRSGKQRFFDFRCKRFTFARGRRADRFVLAANEFYGEVSAPTPGEGGTGTAETKPLGPGVLTARIRAQLDPVALLTSPLLRLNKRFALDPVADPAGDTRAGRRGRSASSRGRSRAACGPRPRPRRDWRRVRSRPPCRRGHRRRSIVR